ncbi:MAG: proline dehydrogenase family protein [Micromonosporaceae bacterium]
MLRRSLLALSKSARIRRLVSTAPYTAGVVARFVAGETEAEAEEVAKRLRADGLLVTLDHLGEGTTEAKHAAAAADEYVKLIEHLAGAGLASGGGAELSVKPTAVGLRLPAQGEKTATGHIARICAAARAAGTTVTVDMEDHATVEATLRIVAELRTEFADLGCVIQSYLRRSERDCEELAQPGFRVRLCKGAYDAPEDVAYPTRQQVDRSYARCLRVLMAGQGYPMIATHDSRLIKIATAQATLAGRPASSYEFQMLYGIRPVGQRRLAGSGAQVRVYVPYGSDWYGYLVRRLAERPANLMFFLRALASRH